MPRLLWASGKVGVDFQGLLVMGDGLVDLSAAGQGHAEVVMGFRVVGLDFQGLLVMGDGLVDLLTAGQTLPRLLWASAKSGLISRAFW